jgi:hypothetical protein
VGGGSTNSVEDRKQREDTLNLQTNETHILIRLLLMYFQRNWEFGSALSKLQNFGGRGVEPPKHKHLHCPSHVSFYNAFKFMKARRSEWEKTYF